MSIGSAVSGCYFFASGISGRATWGGQRECGATVGGWRCAAIAGGGTAWVRHLRRVRDPLALVAGPSKGSSGNNFWISLAPGTRRRWWLVAADRHSLASLGDWRREAWRVNLLPPYLSPSSAAATCLVPTCAHWHLVPMFLLFSPLHVPGPSPSLQRLALTRGILHLPQSTRHPPGQGTSGLGGASRPVQDAGMREVVGRGRRTATMLAAGLGTMVLTVPSVPRS
jgi:hypothetical protein